MISELVARWCGVDYKAYIKSKRWKKKAAAARKRAGFRCQLCNAEGRLQVHHRTYERLGYELPGDLIALCVDCHKKFHGR